MFGSSRSISRHLLPSITLVLTLSEADGFIFTVMPGDVRTVFVSTRFEAVRGAFPHDFSYTVSSAVSFSLGTPTSDNIS